MSLRSFGEVSGEAAQCHLREKEVPLGSHQKLCQCYSHPCTSLNHIRDTLDMLCSYINPSSNQDSCTTHTEQTLWSTLGPNYKFSMTTDIQAGR